MSKINERLTKVPGINPDENESIKQIRELIELVKSNEEEVKVLRSRATAKTPSLSPFVLRANTRSLGKTHGGREPANHRSSYLSQLIPKFIFNATFMPHLFGLIKFYLLIPNWR